jgi:phosphatidylglycerol:prolipoprotein diacylglycerol transferase
MVLNYITWTASPEIFSIGPLTIRWYGLFFALAFAFGYKIMEYVNKREGLPDSETDRVSMHMIVGVVLGARLGHVLFYQPDYYFGFNGQHQHILEIFEIWRGGLASHGAAIGILISLFIYSRKPVVPGYQWILDRIILTVAFGGTLVRLGNLMNSEIYGHETSVPWGFRFVKDPAAMHVGNTPGVLGCIPYNGAIFCPRHPTQIYEALGYILLFLFLFSYYRSHTGPNKDTKPLRPGAMFGMFLILLFGIRFIAEFFKEVQVDFEKGLPMDMGQILSIPFIIVGIFILVRSFKVDRGMKI